MTYNHKQDALTSDFTNVFTNALTNHQHLIAFPTNHQHLIAFPDINKSTTASSSLSPTDQDQFSHPLTAYIVRLDPNVPIPTQATANFAGYNVYSPINTIIPAHDRIHVPLRFCISPPKHYYARLSARSSLARTFGIQVNGGIIEPDYTGEIGILLYNTSTTPVSIQTGEPIGQIIFEAYVTPKLVHNALLVDTAAQEAFTNPRLHYIHSYITFFFITKHSA
jgi:dUTP pyrophosphatase